MEIRFFDSKVEKFIHSLNSETIARILRTIDLLEAFGHRLGLPHSKKIESRLFELRIRGKQEVRFFYTFESGGIIILHGFVKKSQRISLTELKNAREKLKSLDLR